jgi:hypothetical protein
MSYYPATINLIIFFYSEPNYNGLTIGRHGLATNLYLLLLLYKSEFFNHLRNNTIDYYLHLIALINH